MLRITRVQHGESIVLHLEGKLLAAWTDELMLAVQQAAQREIDSPRGSATFQSIHLDLTHVTFVDHAGAERLRQIIGQGAQIIAASNFVAELLQVRKS